MSNVKVAVRVRPFNQREKDRNAELTITMVGQQTTIRNPKTGETKPYTFDYSYWSHDHSQPFASQATVFNDLGTFYLENAFKGYNASIFAYGQTGSGKSYSMVGYGEDKGIIPLGCEELFNRIEKNTDPNKTFQVEISFLEIYNENIRDLFNPKQKEKSLRIRQTAQTGVYVENLKRMACQSYADIEHYMDMGTRMRTVAATNMNATSSRGHSVFTIYFTQTTKNMEAMKASDMTSKINLIDLAGSERVASTGATGDRLKEGANINKSLSALGNVITSLVEKRKVIPYRDSALTRLLQESLGGNSKTIMIAALSPADINYDETLSTLRYADRAKKIVNDAKVNENPNDKLIRELREEIERLKLLAAGKAPLPVAEDGVAEEVGAIKEELEAKEKYIAEMSKTFEERLAESQALAQKQIEELKKTGAASEYNPEDIRKGPHLMNLNEDALLSGSLLYMIQVGVTRVGRNDAKVPQEIALKGLNIQREHCTLTYPQEGAAVTLESIGEAKVWVNGSEVKGSFALTHKDRIVIGNNHFFKFIDPVEALKQEETEAEAAEQFDYEFALKELNASNMKELNIGAEDPKLKEIETKVNGLERTLEELTRTSETQLGILKTDRNRKKEALKSSPADAKAQVEYQVAQKAYDDKKKEYTEKKTTINNAISKLKDEALEHQAERRETQLLEDSLQRLIPMVNEANAIAVQLQRPMVFEVKLMTDITAPTLPGSTRRRTTASVKVTNTDNGNVMIWDQDKFVNRVYIMREDYQQFIDSGHLHLTRDNNPFYDPPEDQLIGLGRIYLAALYNAIEIEGLSTPIIDYSGQAKGELLVEIWPTNSSGDPDEFEDPDDWGEPGTEMHFLVKIICARGLPSHLSSSVYCRYKFFMDEEYTYTPKCATKTINPQFSFESTIHIPAATEALLGYLEKDALSVEVWGSPDEKVNLDSTVDLSLSPLVSAPDTPTPEARGGRATPAGQSTSQTKAPASSQSSPSVAAAVAGGAAAGVGAGVALSALKKKVGCADHTISTSTTDLDEFADTPPAREAREGKLTRQNTDRSESGAPAVSSGMVELQMQQEKAQQLAEREKLLEAKETELAKARDEVRQQLEAEEAKRKEEYENKLKELERKEKQFSKEKKKKKQEDSLKEKELELREKEAELKKQYEEKLAEANNEAKEKEKALKEKEESLNKEKEKLKHAQSEKEEEMSRKASELREMEEAFKAKESAFRRQQEEREAEWRRKEEELKRKEEAHAERLRSLEAMEAEEPPPLKKKPAKKGKGSAEAKSCVVS